MKEVVIKDVPTWLKYAPFSAWLIIYLLTCVVGALLILLDYGSFVYLFEYFSGVNLDLPDHENYVYIVYVLLLGAPVLVWAGYIVGWRLGRVFQAETSERGDDGLRGTWSWAMATY